MSKSRRCCEEARSFGRIERNVEIRDLRALVGEMVEEMKTLAWLMRQMNLVPENAEKLVVRAREMTK